MSKDERATWPQDILVPLEKPFLDARGAIQPLVEHTMRSAMLITSKKGAVRGNHYHKTDWHYLYMVSGRMEYIHRPTNGAEEPKILVVEAKQMIFTPPMVDHAFKFLKDSVWLTLSRNPRDQASYEGDVVRIKLV